MGDTTYTDLLAKIDAAISYQLTSNVASYTIAGRSLTRLPLATLYQMRKEAAFAAARETGGGCSVAQFRQTE